MKKENALFALFLFCRLRVLFGFDFGFWLCGFGCHLVESHEVAFGVLERRDPAHVGTDFLFWQRHRAPVGLDFLQKRVDRVHGHVVHERLSGHHAFHQAAVDATGLVLGGHPPVFGRALGHGKLFDFPAKRFLIKRLRAANVVGRNLKMNNRIGHVFTCAVRLRTGAHTRQKQFLSPILAFLLLPVQKKGFFSRTLFFQKLAASLFPVVGTRGRGSLSRVSRAKQALTKRVDLL